MYDDVHVLHPESDHFMGKGSTNSEGGNLSSQALHMYSYSQDEEQYVHNDDIESNCSEPEDHSGPEMKAWGLIHKMRTLII